MGPEVNDTVISKVVDLYAAAHPLDGSVRSFTGADKSP